jgi:hypothetical protein
VSAHLIGRTFGTMYGAAQLASVFAYVIAGPLVALTGPVVTFLVGGVGTLAAAAALAPALRTRPAG